MKKIIIPIFIFACMLSFAGCMVNSVSFDIEEAAMIRLCSGADGTMVEITDQDDIGRITENINVLKFEKGYSSKDYDEWSYSLTWCDSSGGQLDELVIMDDNRVSYMDYFYVSIGGGIDTAFLDGLLDSKE